jgi:hypothetical protein
LPSHYVRPDGTSLGNKEEIVYFKDPYYRNSKLPFLLRYLLKNEIKQNCNLIEESSETLYYKNILFGGKLKLA